jgi:hypothetical protein
MIRPLSDINDEFRAEIAETPLSARDARSPDGNDDVAGLVSSFGAEAEPKAEAKSPRKPPRHIIPIACAIVAIILIIIAATVLWNGFAPPAERDDPTGGVSGTQSDGDAEGTESADAEPEGQAGAEPDLGEGEYDSALDNLENELNEARKSQDADAGLSGTSDAGGALASGGVAALYTDLVAREYIEELVSVAELGALPSQENRRRLIEGIDARFSDGADGNSPVLPADEVINSDPEFTRLTEAANALINAVNAGRESGSRLSEVIDLRSKAYAIYPIRVLEKLLAIDCEDFGLYCAASERSAEEAYDSLIRSVKYRTEYLRELPYGSGAYYAELRRVGKTFAEIAEIDGADAERKRHAAWIADCLYELAAR